MKQKYDGAKSYYFFVYEKILTIAPWLGLSAAIPFTVSWLMGKFPFVKPAALIVFDIVCLSYFITAHSMRTMGQKQKGELSPRYMKTVDTILTLTVILQWNLISYIFPTRTFWGYAPMFVLLTAFTFHHRTVALAICGISVSIFVSWHILGDQLLPLRDELFSENFSLRVTALFISFGVIYLLTYYSGKFSAQLEESYKKLKNQNIQLAARGRDVIDFTADIIEERDNTSGVHVKRVKTYTRILACQLAKDCPEYGLTDEKIEQIVLACVLHDVGKIAIPDSILQKPGKLTPEEFEIMKTHTVLGARIIDRLPDSVGEEYKNYCRDICQYHHERADGNGYPLGLKGDDIPISAQIVSVVDCYDALSNVRPYKAALPREVAVDMVLNGACGAFSDKMKACIRACREELVNA